MPKVTYIECDGVKHHVEVRAGWSLMEGAVKNNVPGIDADCGGACACATCHVYIEEPWGRLTGDPTPMEESMLEFAGDVRPNSRLACQISVTQAMDGLVVHLPLSQH